MLKRISISILALLFLFALPVIAQYNVIGNGDLETNEPFWWYPQGVGAAREWATDEVLTGVKSLKIAKFITTPYDVGWISGNQAQTFWNHMEGGVLYTIGAVVKTSGVNTIPADMSERIGFYWEFLSGGSQLANIYIPIDQTVADKDWDTLETFVVLGSAPDSAYCYFRFGPNATGTAWADNFRLGSDPWTAGYFGGNVETPVGWMEWHSTSDTGLAEYTDEEAHSGTHSAKLEDLDTLSDEIVFYTIPYPVDPDQMYLLSAWLKTDDVNTDPDYIPSTATLTKVNERLGVCFFYHSSNDPHGWDNLPDQWFYANQVDSIEDWRKYEVVSTSPSNAAAVSIRARFNNDVIGTVYFDDFEVREVTKVAGIEESDDDIVITPYELMQNYPNPFVNETHISYQLPKDAHANLVIYDMLGRKVITLINERQLAGAYTVRWDGRSENGNKVASGIYFYRLATADFQATQKMLILR